MEFNRTLLPAFGDPRITTSKRFSVIGTGNRRFGSVRKPRSKNPENVPDLIADEMEENAGSESMAKRYWYLPAQILFH